MLFSATLNYNDAPYGSTIDMLVNELTAARSEGHPVFSKWEADDLTRYIDAILDDLRQLGWRQ